MGVSENFIGLIQRTSESFIRDNIYMLDKSLIAKALKNIAPQYQEKVLKNMGSEGSAEVKRLMASLGEVSAETVESAQQEIISLASQMM
ncbi:MAG: hypothetical protein FWD78_01805 [Treponema sp.]|nr:hypothetical protein [Treponema sp.]